MKRCVLWMALLLGAHVGLGCGGDDDGGGSGNQAGAGGSSGSTGGGSGTTGGSGGGMIGGEGVVCGTMRCVAPEGATGEPCCMDAFTSTCGMRGGFGGGSCVEIVTSDTRCPSVMLGPIMLPSCCNTENQCGINGAMFGMAGCTELSVAEQMAMERASMFMGAGDEDGGSPFPFDAGGFSLDFPPAQACE